MNLLESLGKTQTQRAQQPVPGQAANLRKLLASKSGKAGAATGPAISGIQEQQALKDFGTQATVQQQAGQIAAEQQKQAQAAQTQQTTQAQQRLSNQRAAQQQQFDQQVAKVTNNLQRFKNDLESAEGKQALAEALHTRRLADKEYMTNLERVGQEKRLLDRQAFELEAGKTAFENWQELFNSEQEFQKVMDLNDAEYKKGLAQMGIDQARSVVQSNIEAMNRQAQWSALGSFGSGLIQAGMTEYKTDDGNKTTFFNEMFSSEPESPAAPQGDFTIDKDISRLS